MLYCEIEQINEINEIIKNNENRSFIVDFEGQGHILNYVCNIDEFLIYLASAFMFNLFATDSVSFFNIEKNSFNVKINGDKFNIKLED